MIRLDATMGKGRRDQPTNVVPGPSRGGPPSGGEPIVSGPERESLMENAEARFESLRLWIGDWSDNLIFRINQALANVARDAREFDERITRLENELAPIVRLMREAQNGKT